MAPPSEPPAARRGAPPQPTIEPRAPAEPFEPGPTKVVLLGTSGGPAPVPRRSGIAQALIVNGLTYVVDCGSGVGRQLVLAGYNLPRLNGVFLTHLHSDHDADYFNLFLLGWRWIQEGVKRRGVPVQVWGPGTAGGLEALPEDRLEGRPDATPAPVVNPANPTPGLLDITAAHIEAHAYDMNLRMRQSGHVELTTLFEPREVPVPDGIGARGPDRVAPTMDPVLVAEDDNVRVTAILVEHPPVFPSFAYRFDTDDGSVVFSGDTRPCANLVRLARGADVLVHEVMDPDAGRRAVEAVPTLTDLVGWESMRRHMFASHTSRDDVGAVAAEAGVRKLVLTHFIPSQQGRDEDWMSAARAAFDGEVVVGRDLLEVEL